MRDLAVLRAMEQIARAPFLAPAHAVLSARDLPVPIAGGETASPAWLVARMIEAAAIEPGMAVLQVGAGCGYGTAILRQIGAAVTAVERVRSLAEHAAARLAALGMAADVAWADVAWGDAAPAGEVCFYDRILVHSCCEALPLALLGRLVGSGVLVCARPTAAGQEVRRIEAGEGASGGAEWRETAICGCRLAPLRRGLSGL